MDWWTDERHPRAILISTREWKKIEGESYLALSEEQSNRTLCRTTSRFEQVLEKTEIISIEVTLALETLSALGTNYLKLKIRVGND